MTDPTTLTAAPAAPPTPAAVPSVMLTLSGVTRSFAGRQVLGPVQLTLDAGVLAVVTGPNGAGKTTLLRVAAGLLAASDGTRMCTGRAVYLRPGSGTRASLTVAQALAQTAALACSSPAAIAQARTAAGLTELTGRRVGELSAGQHARLSVALAAAATPALACLDEPTAHLDADGVDRVRAVIRLLLATAVTVLVASHSPDHFADLADGVLRLEGGLLREATC